MIEPRHSLPVFDSRVRIDLRQRQRSSDKATVGYKHPHHFAFLSQSASIGPLADTFESIYPSAGPRSNIQTTFVLSKRIGLRVVAKLTAVDPFFTIESVDVPAVIAAGVKMAIEHGRRPQIAGDAS